MIGKSIGKIIGKDIIRYVGKVRRGAVASQAATVIAQYFNETVKFVGGLLYNNIADENHFTPVDGRCVKGNQTLGTAITLSAPMIDYKNKWFVSFKINYSSLASYEVICGDISITTPLIALSYGGDKLIRVRDSVSTAHIFTLGDASAYYDQTIEIMIFCTSTEMQLYINDVHIQTLATAGLFDLQRILNRGDTPWGYNGKLFDFKAGELTADAGSINKALIDSIIASKTGYSWFPFDKYPSGATIVTPTFKDVIGGIVGTMSGHDETSFTTLDERSYCAEFGCNFDGLNAIPASQADVGNDVDGAPLVHGADNSQGKNNKYKVVSPTAELIALDADNKFVDGSEVPIAIDFDTWVDASYTETTKDENGNVTDFKIMAAAKTEPTINTTTKIVDASSLGWSTATLDAYLLAATSLGYNGYLFIIWGNSTPTKTAGSAYVTLGTQGNFFEE